MQTERKYYPGITVFKVLGAILVLFSHVQLPAIYQHLTKSVAGVAASAAFVVPCFYMASGFLAYNSWLHSTQPMAYLKRHLSWITVIYCAFCSIFIFGTLLPDYLHQPTNWHTTLAFLKKSGNILLSRGYPHLLYFVPPLILGTIGSFYFVQTNKLRLGLIVAIAGFLLAQLVSGTFTGFAPMFAASIKSKFLKALIVHNLGLGFPFVFAGVLTAIYTKVFLRLNAVYLSIVCAICIAAELLVLNIFSRGGYNYRIGLSLVPSSILLFYGVLHIKGAWIQRYHTQLNSFSIVTYFSQYFFIHFNQWAFPTTGDQLNIGQTLEYLLTLTECILTTVLYLQLRRVKKPKFAAAAATD